ncbi:MAG: T9SS type A sorting domain-containing protein [Lewinella sp.]|nr:T9SS type A sorting domain-containing protein [Lewinella sp.]
MGLDGSDGSTYPNGQVWAGNYEPFPNFDYAFRTFTCSTGACSGEATAQIEVYGLPEVTFSTGDLSVQVDAGVQTGLGGGLPAGGVYSGNGVTDDGNGMTYSFDPAAAGEGENVITYTYSDGNGCGGMQSAIITVTNAPLPNDVCTDALDINTLFGGAYNEPQTSGTQDNTGYNTEGDPASGYECFYEPSIEHTIWYSFTGDGNTYSIRSVACGAENPIPDTDTQFALYSGDCAMPTAVACNDDEDLNNDLFNSYLELATEPGVSYLLLVDGYNGGEGTFCLEVTNLAEPMALPGDSCAIAIDLSALFGQEQMVAQVSDEYDNTGYSTYENDPATNACGWTIDAVSELMWFAFTGDGNRYSIKSLGGRDLAATLYSGDCGNRTELSCNDDDNGLNFGLEIQTEAGVDYLLLVLPADLPAGVGAFNLEVTNLGSVNVQDISQTDYRLYPNPTTGRVQLDGFTADRIEVYDSFGRLVRQQATPGNGLDLDGLPAGVYTLKLAIGDERVSARVVKQ